MISSIANMNANSLSSLAQIPVASQVDPVLGFEMNWMHENIYWKIDRS